MHFSHHDTELDLNSDEGFTNSDSWSESQHTEICINRMNAGGMRLEKIKAQIKNKEHRLSIGHDKATLDPSLLLPVPGHPGGS